MRWLDADQALRQVRCLNGPDSARVKRLVSAEREARLAYRAALRDDRQRVSMGRPEADG